jgi:hypothetical protein
MCLRRAPEKYIAGAALDRAGLDSVRFSTYHNNICLHVLLRGNYLYKNINYYFVINTG